MQFNREAVIDLMKQGVLDQLPVEARSVLIGLFSDGLRGALDAAVLNQIDKLPPVLRDIAGPFLESIDLTQVPGQIASAVSGFFNSEGPGLNFSMQRITDALNLGNIDIGGIFDSITSGGLGGITNLLSDFGGFDLFSMIPGSGIIRTASTIFDTLFGGGDLFGNLFGNGGFGITSILDTLGVSSTITGLIAPILGLFGFGGGKSKCPCDPSCRKTDHFVVEDGTELLKEDKCETVISNSSTSYFSGGGIPDPGLTNGNILSAAYGFVTTALGSSLIPDNILNLTGAILGISRLSNLGSEVESAQNADWPDFVNEISYSMKAIENGFKITDNNLTGVEKILRLFLDGGFFENEADSKRDQLVIESLTTALESIAELYAMIISIDQTKLGSQTATAMPAIATKKSAAVRPLVEKLRGLTAARHLKTAESFLNTALEAWNALDPGTGSDSVEGFTPGSASNPSISEAWNAEVLGSESERFTTSYYRLLKNLEFTENNETRQDILNQISLKYSEGGGNSTGENFVVSPLSEILKNITKSQQVDPVLLDKLINEQNSAQRRKANC